MNRGTRHEVFMFFAERIFTTFLSKKPSFKAKQESAGLCCLSNTRPDANLGSPVLFTRPAWNSTEFSIGKQDKFNIITH